MIMRQPFFRDLPWEQEIYDYGIRTDGQPVYMAHSKLGTGTDERKWVIFFFKYNVGGNMIEKYSLEGAWDDRAVLFVDYA
jgi:hypothetical protein